MIILILLLVFNNAFCSGKQIYYTGKYDIKIIAFKSEPVVKGQKESIAIFECLIKNNSTERLNDIYKLVYVKEGPKNAEIYYISPQFTKELEPGQEARGIIAFKIYDAIEPYSVFLNPGDEEKQESLNKLTSDFSEPYLKAEQIAIRLKVKFDREDYSERSNYDSIKQFIESPDKYFDNLYIKYELLADYKKYTEKIPEEELSGLYFKSFDLGNRELTFVRKKYIPALSKPGLRYYDEDNYDSSYSYFSKTIAADSNFIFSTAQYFDLIYAYSYSATELWVKDKNRINIDLAIYYLERLSKIKDYSNKCKAYLQTGNIYLLKYEFSGKQNEESRTRAKENYNKILSSENKCTESQQNKAIENLGLLKKQE